MERYPLPGTRDLSTEMETATQILRLASIKEKTLQATLEDILDECQRLGVIDLMTSVEMERVCSEVDYEEFFFNRERDIEEILEDNAEREYERETIERIHKERKERHERAVEMYNRIRDGRPQDEGEKIPFFNQ